MRKYLSLMAVCGLLAGSAAADLKVTSTNKSTGMASMGDGQTVTYIKGMKVRTDSRSGGDVQTMVLDIDARQMIVYSSKKKKAQVYDMTPMAEQQVSIGAGDVSIEPTGNTREVAGYTCEDHNISVVISAGMAGAPGMDMDIAMKGPVCLSKKAPGADEYAQLYTAMAEKGLFFAPPEAAQAQPGRERGMTQLYKAMAERGVGLATQLDVGFEGSGMMAKMMKKMNFTTTTEVTDISDAPLADSLFEVPAGYKIKKQ